MTRVQRRQSALGAALLSSVGVEGALGSAVAQKLSAAITMGLIADGEQLPTEADLAAQLAVSTVSLRAALVILRQEGLVETRRGRHGGSFIRAPRDYSSAKSTERLAAMSPTQIRDLGYELMAVTGMVASLAARRFDDDNIARLLGLAAQLGAAELPEQRLSLDSRFRIEVAVTSQSERLTRRMVTLQAEYSYFLWLPAVGLDHGVCAGQHQDLVKAIRAGDADRARSLAEAHVADDTGHILELRWGLDG
ncbi:MAG: GntR family transcriptional regulator [Actinomycetota bacterium]|nr:GntR family transcriptional regulator [Actinomycetota bacterium]